MKDRLLAHKLDWARGRRPGKSWSCADGRPDWGWFRWGAQLHAWWRNTACLAPVVQGWNLSEIRQLLLAEELDPGFLPLPLCNSFETWHCFRADFSRSILKSNLSQDDSLVVRPLENSSRIAAGGFFSEAESRLLEACGSWLGLESGGELLGVILQAFEKEQTLQLEAWTMCPDARGRGLGKILFRHACQGAESVRLLRQADKSRFQDELGFRRETGYILYLIQN